MGSGGMIVMDETTCMVDVAKYFMSFLKDESCGKCFTCRKGTQRMCEILDASSRGGGTLRAPRPAGGAGARGQGHHACAASARPRPTRCSSTLALLPRRVRGAHHRQALSGGVSARALIGAPCQSACPLGHRTCLALRRRTSPEGRVRRGLPVDPRGQPLPVGLRPRLPPPLRGPLPGGTTGDPVAVRALKRFVTDRARPSGSGRSAPRAAERVAVVGPARPGSPPPTTSSLTGFQVTVFEAVPAPADGRGRHPVVPPAEGDPQPRRRAMVKRLGVEFRLNAWGSAATSHWSR